MADITTRETSGGGATVKGSPLTNSEVDTNFINLNTDKVEVSGAIIFVAKAGEALSKGDVVYVSGVSGNEPVVSKADANDASKMPAFGLAEADANNNAAVNVVTFGTLYDLDTSAFSAGDTVYVSTTAGGLTTTKPAGEASLLQNMGKVIRSHASAGSIKVGGAGRTNDVPNLNDGNVFIGNASNQAEARALVEDDISDLQAYLTSVSVDGLSDATITAVADNEVLAYDATSAEWINQTAAEAGLATSAQGSLADSALQNVVEDTTPQLGGTLDANGNNIDMGVNLITDTKVGQWDTAYGWGDHASGGYLTTVSVDGLSDATITTPADNELFAYNSATSEWINQTPAEAGFATVATSGAYSDLSGTPTNVSTFTNDAGYLTAEADTLDSVTGRGNTTANAITVGSASISGDLTVDTSTLYVDSTNNEVGIGLTNPSANLHVKGATGIIVQDDAGSLASIDFWNSTGTSILTAKTGVSDFFLDNKAGKTVFRDGSATALMTIEQSGNVGIGATSPSNTLTVSKNVTGDDLVYFNNENAVASDVLRLNTLGAGSGTKVLDCQVAGVSKFVVNGLGDVGIGVTSPTSGKLCVDGTINITDTAGAYAAGALGYTDANWGFLHRPPRAGAIGAHAFQSFAGSTLMTVTDGGNVGIGTSSPASFNSSGNDLVVGNGVASNDTGITVYTNSNATGHLLFADGTSGSDSYTGYIRYSHASDFMAFHTNAGAERMRIDSSGNVGIGTTSPSSVLTSAPRKGSDPTASSTITGLNLYNGQANVTGDGVQLLFDHSYGTPESQTRGAFIRTVTNNSYAGSVSLAIGTSSGDSLAERMRIDSSGNLLVGMTSYASSSVGTTMQSGLLTSARNGNIAGYFNRLSSDGNIVAFAKDGSTVGSIFSHSSGNVGIGTGDTGLLFAATTDSLQPWNTSTNSVRDNAIDLGIAGGRFDDIYATNGTIQTSDVNEKQDIEALSEAEQRVAVAAKALLRKFRWKSAVEEKGDDARVHFGVIAQDLQAAFEAEGLDAGDYGMFIHSTWTDEETSEERSRMGVRYSELLAFIIAAI